MPRARGAGDPAEHCLLAGAAGRGPAAAGARGLPGRAAAAAAALAAAAGLAAACWLPGGAGGRRRRPGPPARRRRGPVALAEAGCECGWAGPASCAEDDGGECFGACCAAGAAGGAAAVDAGGAAADAATPDPAPGGGFFCFVVLRSSGYEPGLMRRQHSRGAGIFACESQAVFCTDELHLAPGVEAIRFTPAEVGTSKDDTAANAQLFMNAWDAVRSNRKYQGGDWTIKTDPDCVFLPAKLKPKLAAHNGELTFVRNCNAWPGSDDFPMMLGALEVLSRSAVDAYFEGADKCRGLDWTSWGEDLFLGKCLMNLGVPPLDDDSVLVDGICTQSTEPPGERPPPESCAVAGAAAFHAFKDTERWERCLDEATGAQ